MGAELFAEDADEFAAFGCGHVSPFEIGLVRLCDGVGCGRRRDSGNVGDDLTGDRGAHGQVSACIGFAGDAKLCQQRVDFVLKGQGEGNGCKCAHERLLLSAV